MQSGEGIKIHQMFRAKNVNAVNVLVNRIDRYLLEHPNEHYMV